MTLQLQLLAALTTAVHVAVAASQPPASSVPTPADNLSLVASSWVTAAFTALLCLVAVVALIVARRQLDTVKDERTVNLIREASSDKLTELLDFFDFAADVRVSHRAFSDLFARLIRSRPPEIANRQVLDVSGAATVALGLIKRELDRDNTGETEVERCEKALRRRIVDASYFLERVWILVDRGAINKDLFFKNQAYIFVAPYYVLEEVLHDLERHEGFEFSGARELARVAQTYLDWLGEDHPLRTASFLPLRLDVPTLREQPTAVNVARPDG
jgi:hypothetical protein